MSRNLLLVEFPWGRDKDPRVPLGHASILAMLKTIPDFECRSLVKPINDPDFELHDVTTEILNELSIMGKNESLLSTSSPKYLAEVDHGGFSLPNKTLELTSLGSLCKPRSNK